MNKTKFFNNVNLFFIQNQITGVPIKGVIRLQANIYLLGNQNLEFVINVFYLFLIFLNFEAKNFKSNISKINSFF